MPARVLIPVASSLVLLLLVAPIALAAAMALLVIVAVQPKRVAKVHQHSLLRWLPGSLRTTPRRAAVTLLIATLALTMVRTTISSAEPAGIGASPQPSPGATAEAPTPTPLPTADLTPRPTTTPAPRPTSIPTTSAAPSRSVVPTAATALPIAGSRPTGPTEVAIVVAVTDGDTIRVVIDGTEYPVRYIGIDTPEVRSGAQPFGVEASAANAALVAGHEVVLEKDVSETDRFGRLLRYVWVEQGANWLFVNEQLLRLGVAQVTTYPPDVKYVDSVYLAAQEAAREAGLGLWGAPAEPPPGQGTSDCEPSYPAFCLPVGSADLDCGDIEERAFTVRWDVAHPDPHRFDGNGDGLGCEG